MSKGKVNLSSAQITDKWMNNTKGGVNNYKIGIDNVTESPTEKAAQKADKYLAGVQESVLKGKFQAGLRAVTLQDWKTKAKDKGAGRIGAGVDGAKDKHLKFSNYLVTTLNGVLPEINNMPDMNLEDSVARVRKLMEHMANNPYKKS